VDVEITFEYKRDKDSVECKVRNKKDVLQQKFDICFIVDIERLFLGPQVEYTSSPEWVEVEGNRVKVKDINLVNALDAVHSRSVQRKSDECQYVVTIHQGQTRKAIVGIENGNKRPYMIIPSAIPIMKIEYEAVTSDRYVWDYF